MTDFVYDCRNRLIQAGDTRYTYDAENNRIGVETGESKTTYVVNTQPELSQILQSTETKIEENDNKENAITTYYFYGNGLNSQDNGESYFVYHFNNVGSTMTVTDAKGGIVENYSYTPYGELITGEYREDILFLYNGQYGVATDGNGLYYMRARYYNVEIKRFINQDVLLGVLERVSSLNRYAYVEGNPISYLDPFGLAKSIYDETYAKLVLLEMDLLHFCTMTDITSATVNKLISSAKKTKMDTISEILIFAELIPVVTFYCTELGVCIGKAYEGLSENDYSKIDSAYKMMGETLNKLTLTLATIALDNITGTPIYGLFSDVLGYFEAFKNDYYKEIGE